MAGQGESFRQSHHHAEDKRDGGGAGQCRCGRNCACCSGCRCAASGCTGGQDDGPRIYPGEEEEEEDDDDDDDDDDDEPVNQSWAAPLPVGGLTHGNIDRFNVEAGDGRADFLRKHEIDVDARPDLYFLSARDATVEAGGGGGGMEDSLYVEDDALAGDSRSSHQCMVASTVSVSAVLPDMRIISLVYHPLPLVPDAGPSDRLIVS